VKNLYCLYLHDLSQYNGARPNRHGVLEPNERTSDLVKQGDIFSQWWTDGQGRYPYLIYVEESPAGFAFVAGQPHAPENADFWVYEFFLLHAFRGQGVGQQAARKVIDQFSGDWGLTTFAQDKRAEGFWTKTLSGYASDFSAHTGPSPYGDGIDRLFFKFRTTDS